MLIKRLYSRGDTIVEVLLAIAVASIVLTGAYVVSNQSLKGTRAGEERGEALKFVQSQVEQLKYAATVSPTNSTLFSHVTPFCLDASNNISSSCTVGIGVQYSLTINRSGSAANGYTFTVAATWDSVFGTGKDNVTMLYKLDQ